MSNIIESLSKELNKAQDIIRRIASMGHDSTDKEIAEEAIKLSRQYVNWEIITPQQIKLMDNTEEQQNCPFEHDLAFK